MTTYEVGQTAVVTISTPGGAVDTTLTVTVTSPETGTVTNPVATPNGGHTSWTFNLLVDEAGDWAIVAVAEGSGANEDSLVLHVAPQPPADPGAYATTADWAAKFGAPPDGIAETLSMAELEVRAKIRSAIYEVDGDGLPSDATQRAAVRLATVLQAKFMRTTGRATGVDGGNTNFSIGKVSVGRGGPAKVVGGMPGDPTFSAHAWQVLFDAQLTGWGPQSF